MAKKVIKFFSRVKKIRSELELSEEQFAELVGLEVKDIIEIELKVCKPAKYYLQIADKLGLSFIDIIAEKYVIPSKYWNVEKIK